MKKLLTIAVFAALMTTASAVSFTWSSSTAIKFDGSNLKSDTAVTGYLIYLSSGSFADSYTINEESTASTLSSSIGTQIASQNKTTALSKISGVATFDYGTYANGDTFGMLLVYANEGKTYFQLSSNTQAISGLSDETSTPAAMNFTFSHSGPTESTTVSSGSGWVQAVPEPSTAALALAGLALLLKRRKA